MSETENFPSFVQNFFDNYYMKNAVLITIGDEILSGKRSDKHLPKVIELLSRRGLALSWVRLVGDDRTRITAALRDAFASIFDEYAVGRNHDFNRAA